MVSPIENISAGSVRLYVSMVPISRNLISSGAR